MIWECERVGGQTIEDFLELSRRFVYIFELSTLEIMETSQNQLLNTSTCVYRLFGVEL